MDLVAFFFFFLFTVFNYTGSFKNFCNDDRILSELRQTETLKMVVVIEFINNL